MTMTRTLITDSFAIENIAPDTQAVNSALSMMSLPLDINAIRSMMDEMGAQQPGGPYLSPRAEVVDVPASGASLRVVRPDGDAVGAAVLVHGGGWSFGAASEYDQKLEDLADRFGLVGVSVEYRLAPEYPYPTPLDDVYGALTHIIRGDPSLNPSGLVVVIAESAGANLALSATVRLKEVGEQTPAGIALFYGAYDLTQTPSQINFGTAGMVNSLTLPFFYSLYAPQEDMHAPAISPLYANLQGLPPTLLLAGTNDPLTDDTLFLDSRLLASGVDVTLHLAPGGSHGFNHFPSQVASDAQAAIDDFLSLLLRDRALDRRTSA